MKLIVFFFYQISLKKKKKKNYPNYILNKNIIYKLIS